MNDEIINARKEYSKIKNESKKLAKRDSCMWCGKKTTKFCNSHTVPQFVLKNIDTDGKLDYFNTFMHIPIINDDKGIKDAATFGLLCNECDSKLFQDYENPDNLKEKPTNIMLCEIALKNILMWLSKRFWELQLFEKLKNKSKIPYDYEQKQNVNRLDERDFLWDYQRIKEMIEKNVENKRFKIISWDKLNYKIPLAFQGAFSIYGDMFGQIVEDIYTHDENKINQHMHMCAFPMDDCSVVITFYHEDDTNYDSFANQITNMDVEERLKFLGYILFYTSEDMLLAKKIPHKTYFNNKVREVFAHTTELRVSSVMDAEYQKEKVRNAFKNWKPDMFPWILTEKYAVRDDGNFEKH